LAADPSPRSAIRGDQQMLEYTQSGSGARFELLVLHDDAKREFATARRADCRM